MNEFASGLVAVFGLALFVSVTLIAIWFLISRITRTGKRAGKATGTRRSRD